LVSDSTNIAEAVARASYGRLLAFIAARTGDVAAAEDALSDAFATALTTWPAQGVPDKPEAWLLTVARRRLIDTTRRNRTSREAAAHLQLLAEEYAIETPTAIPDERLTLLFVCAHPAIDPPVRAPLMLQTVLGLDAATIASAFLTAPATMGQRLVRAKTRIKLAGIPFHLPERADLPERLAAVLDAIYAAFAAGWTDPNGTDFRRRDLALEAIWLCRLLVSLLPEEPEALGLLALMLYAESRRGARRSADGDYVPLDEQDVSSWDAKLIQQAEALLLRASRMGAVGRFQLEAAVQSAHGVRRQTGRTDWAAIVRLYDALETLTGSPVVAINRAVAVAEIDGADAGLAALDRLADDPRLADYQPYWAARAGLLARTESAVEAAAAYRRAIGLEADPAVRRFLQFRLSAQGEPANAGVRPPPEPTPD
jgi:RNA polymerase sigma-70 factor, ECF subfamily